MKTSIKLNALTPVAMACVAMLLSACGPQDGGSAKPQPVAAAPAAVLAPAPVVAPVVATAPAAPAETTPAPAPVKASPPPAPRPAAKPAPVQTANKAPTMQKVAAQPPAPRPDTVGAVQAIEPITETKSSGAGAVVGGLLGGVVGHQFGKGDGKKAMTVVGAVGGAVAGNEVEKHQNKKVIGYRVKVQLDNGESRTFEPAQLGDLKVGDRVRIDQGQLHKA